MASDSFTFQQFTVRHDLCGMKVGTDGVLLGAWATGGRRILDIGTGSGLVALMMAQRFLQAEIDAIDIDADACRQAEVNVAASPFGNRIRVMHAALQAFEGTARYDSIVSNPPFFTTGQRSDERSRALARHADTLPYSALFQGVGRLLTPDGVFSAIIPTDFIEAFVAEACFNGFSPIRRCTVRTTAKKAPRRTLVAFSRQAGGSCQTEDVVLQNQDGSRTQWYNNLTKSFYIR